MVILGGLELAVGGYFVHRYYKNKNEKMKLREEAQQRRHNTFPGAKPHSCYPYPQQQPQVIIPQQKYACYAPQPQPQPQPQYQHQPPPVQHTQSFTIARRPLPAQQQQQQQQQALPQIIQPLQRSDSFATISRMPIANGYRPSDTEDEQPQLPPRQYNSNLSPIPQSPMSPPYSHTGFSVSSPALAPAPTTPIQAANSQFGRQTVDDNWETYGTPAGHPHYSPSVSTALGEDDPPPPYHP